MLGMLLFCVAAILAIARGTDRGDPVPTPPDYDRKAWAHWQDADDDCQDTRHEVLARASLVPVEYRADARCKVARGRWRCPYTGKLFEDPSELDVDHMVPLHEAHASGGAAWSPAKKARYANDLRDPDHLVVVARTANRAKGSRRPDAWLPEDPASRCDYIEDWVRIKVTWGLAFAPVEQRALDDARVRCRRGRAPAAPQDQKPRRRRKS